MNNAKITKRALLTSIVALVMCFTMLVGTTFAWFTDSVTSENNVIKSGNLDITLEYYNGTSWVDVKDADDILAGDLWEPGYVDVAYLRIKNAGSLALKYQLGVNIVSETDGKTPAGETITLSDYIYFDVIEGVNGQTSAYASREAALAVTTETTIISEGYTKASSLEAGSDYTYLAMVVYMPVSVGNEANHDGTNIPEINLGISIYATQYTKESDSFDDQYDADAKLVIPVSDVEAFFDALDDGSDVLLDEAFVIDDDFINYAKTRYASAASGTRVDGNNVIINGNGSTVYRTAATKDASMITVGTGYTLTLEDITLDGGAVWDGAVDPTLGRGTVNSGITTSSAIVYTASNSNIVLDDGAIIQNNDGSYAVNLDTRKGSTLTLNGGQIINNNSAAGAIWGGGNITMNDGAISYNSSTGPAGAIRMVSSCNLNISGGEMNNNKAATDGGAIWGYGSSTYTFTGGSMSGNESGGVGGAIYTGTYSIINISGDFEMCDNKATNSGAIRLTDHTSLSMSGGTISGNTQGGESNAFNTWNNSMTLTGGLITDNISYVGGLGLTVGAADIDGVIAYNLATTHNTAYLTADFEGFSFTVDEANANFANFNFKPASDYVYTDGDEDKLVCLNDGYVTYWDETTSTFRLKAGA